MKKLIALYPVLYLSKQYSVGDELPANNESMVSAWLEAGTAQWIENSLTGINAAPATAQAGIAGDAIGPETDGDDLVGKVPKTPARSRK